MHSIQRQLQLQEKPAGGTGLTLNENASEVIPHPAGETLYETACGRCGAQFHFRQALTSWVTVYCYRCLEYVSVR